MFEVCHGYSPVIFKRMNKKLLRYNILGTIVYDRYERMFYLYTSESDRDIAARILL